MSGYIDLHCHILPEVDDGPASLEAAVELVRGMEAMGFREMVPTPHQKPGSWMPDEAQCQEAAARLRLALRESGSELVVRPPGGELMWSEALLDPQPGAYRTYPGGKAVLLEFYPFAMPGQLDERLYELRLAGKLPVLAHVERYPHLMQNPETLKALARNAVLTVNLASLGGWWTSRDARRLVREGGVQVVASDCHGINDLEPCLKGLAWLDRTLGNEATRRLLVENPLQALAGELPER